MPRNKKGNKVLVRNLSAPVQNIKPVEKGQNNLKKVHFSEDVLSKPQNSRFTAPEFCTLLQLADEMKTVKNIQRSTRSLSEASKSRHLNFLPEERIFQDLVGLDIPDEEIVNEVRIPPCVKLKKDPELDFEKYNNQSLHSEHFFTSYAVPDLTKQETILIGRAIYHNLVTWKNKN